MAMSGEILISAHNYFFGGFPVGPEPELVWPPCTSFGAEWDVGLGLAECPFFTGVKPSDNGFRGGLLIITSYEFNI